MLVTSINPRGMAAARHFSERRMFGLIHKLVVRVFQNADEAIVAGFDRDAEYKDAKPVELRTAVVVRDGTVGGNSTVDLVLVDECGNKYVAILTGALLKGIPA